MRFFKFQILPHFIPAFLFTFFLFTIDLNLSAQQISLDSLLHALEISESDSEKLFFLDELSWQLRSKKPEQAMKYAQEAYELSIKAGDKEHESNSLVRMASIHRRQNNYEAALNALHKSLAISMNLDNPKDIGRASAQLTSIYTNRGSYDSGLHYGSISLKSYLKANNEDRVAKAHGRLALLHELKGDFDISIKHYIESLKIKEKRNDSTQIAKTFQNMAALYIRMRIYRQALYYAKKANSYFRLLNNQQLLAKSHTNLGVAYRNLGDSVNAICSFETSIEINNSLGKQELNSENYNNLGVLYLLSEQLDKAEKLFLANIKFQENQQAPESLQFTYTNIGEVKRLKGDYLSALEFYKKALGIAEKRNSFNGLIKIYSNMAGSYQSIGDYENAFYYLNKSQSIQDSVGHSFKEAIDIKAKYEQEKQEKADLEKEKEVQAEKIAKQNVMVTSLTVGLVMTLVIMFMTFLAFRSKQKAAIAEKDKALKDKEIEDVLRDQEIMSYNAMLQGQESERQRIAQDLHDDVGNMLTVAKMSINGLVEHANDSQKSKMQFEKANDLIDEVHLGVRRVAHNMASGKLTKFGLIPALESIRRSVEENSTIETELVLSGLEERLNLKVEMEIYRTIQELVTNALKHAHATELSIQVLRKEKEVLILVEDNGVGFDQQSEEFEFGLGIRSTEKRIEGLNGTIEVDAYPNRGTTVNIQVPIKIEDDDKDNIS